ncbi:MerR family transcriptional regulator [Breznakiella homolactica]|uniref:MerR family transcriptional regulator n=1 Tax=Breznakiella homolactica TaxID=2798577 RepID=A0A7T8B7N1_9SPIR|nr:MerR family transcriptional regulator [Breznakiella homolactica]QQO07684.1 MerR family transcriptional regulator [Breznakiella homolactica]
MEKHRAIPQGYMTVGEAAKKVNTTVFTLQYYDNENILKPSGKSEGGRRLYTHRDIVKLHQIQSMKYLGFSLADIKDRLPSLNTTGEVAGALSEQARGIREKISALSDVLEATEKLQAEVLEMETVDWEKYADILDLLRAKHDLYWAIKHFDGRLLDHAHSFDREDQEKIMNAQKRVFKKAAELRKKGIPPESEQGQALAKEYWDIAAAFTKGDESLLPELARLAEKWDSGGWKSEHEFIESAFDTFIAGLGYDPFKS